MYCISNFHWAFLLLFIYMVRINQVSKLIFDPSKEKNIRMKGIDCSENITQKCICAVSTIIFMGGYERFRGEWVKDKEKNHCHLFMY